MSTFSHLSFREISELTSSSTSVHHLCRSYCQEMTSLKYPKRIETNRITNYWEWGSRRMLKFTYRRVEYTRKNKMKEDVWKWSVSYFFSFFSTCVFIYKWSFLSNSTNKHSFVLLMRHYSSFTLYINVSKASISLFSPWNYRLLIFSFDCTQKCFQMLINDRM